MNYWSLNTQEVSVLGPLSIDSLKALLGNGESIDVRGGDSLEALRVVDWYDGGRVVAD